MVLVLHIVVRSLAQFARTGCECRNVVVFVGNEATVNAVEDRMRAKREGHVATPLSLLSRYVNR